jgi:hypothetical protein
MTRFSISIQDKTPKVVLKNTLLHNPFLESNLISCSQMVQRQRAREREWREQRLCILRSCYLRALIEEDGNLVIRAPADEWEIEEEDSAMLARIIIR